MIYYIKKKSAEANYKLSIQLYSFCYFDGVVVVVVSE